MTVAAADSAFDVAYWLFDHAESAGWHLETEKLQCLLFLAQVHFAAAHRNEYLFPGVFICNKDGFIEPNLNKILAMGRPFMTTTQLPKKAKDFLEVIWKKYGNQSVNELANTIKSSKAYKDNYRQGMSNIVELSEIVKNFKTSDKEEASSFHKKKILISQNGPVVVSQWQPRKITNENTKGDKNV